MRSYFNSEYPSVDHLRAKAKARMPGFAYDYLAAGCFSEVNLARNNSDIRKVQLKPWYLRDFEGAAQARQHQGTDNILLSNRRAFTPRQSMDALIGYAR